MGGEGCFAAPGLPGQDKPADKPPLFFPGAGSFSPLPDESAPQIEKLPDEKKSISKMNLEELRELAKQFPDKINNPEKQNKASLGELLKKLI